MKSKDNVVGFPAPAQLAPSSVAPLETITFQFSGDVDGRIVTEEVVFNGAPANVKTGDALVSFFTQRMSSGFPFLISDEGGEAVLYAFKDLKRMRLSKNLITRPQVASLSLA